jgi:hypothetical protein
LATVQHGSTPFNGSTRLPETALRRRRIAALWWLGIAVVVWNALYDILLTRATKEYLRRHAMHEAGRGPAVGIAEIMDPAVYEAIWKATLAAGLLLLAGLLTIKYVGRTNASSHS